MKPPEIHPETVQRLSASADIRPWLDEMHSMTGPRSRPETCRLFIAIMHGLRAQLTAEDAASLARDLPPIVRDIFDEDRPSAVDNSVMDIGSYVTAACPWLAPGQAERAIWSAFTLLSHHVDPDVIRRVRDRLPPDTRAMWNTAA